MLIGQPMGQLLASLPPEQRAGRYREFGAIAVLQSHETTDPVLQDEYLTMASGWHAVALEAERLVDGAITGEDVSPDHDETAADESP